LLPKETVDYVPRVLAAIALAKKTDFRHAVRRLSEAPRRVADPTHEAAEYQIE